MQNLSRPATHFTSPRSRLAALLAAHLLLSACSATAQPGLLTSPAIWPEPKPAHWPQAQAVQWPAAAPALQVPNFQAPSAAHCARPIATRELPGRPLHSNSLPERDAELRKHAWPTSPAAARSAPVPAPASAAAMAAPEALADLSASPAPAARSKADASAERAEQAASAKREPSPQALSARPQQQPRLGPVTAGMVDDNANFSEYLAYQSRTNVVHRPRDVSERYLLEVKDARGRSVADAEVAVQSGQGAAMWARTDTAGRVWLHPRAFDPSGAPLYDVTVRKNGRQAQGVLQRGQKSALEVRLPAQVGQTEKAQLDLVFLIDATGSMADEIGKLKASLRSIAAEVARLPSQPDLCFGLVAYRDKGDAFLLRSHDFTNDLSAFQGVLNALQADNGGDYPEAMNEALHETVHKLSWRGSGTTRLVVLLADAPPHLDYGSPYYDDDMLAALGKGIKIFSVGASGLDKQGEYIQRQIAQYTGGRFVFLTYAQAHNPASGPGRETLHDVNNYSVQTLDRLIVRLVSEELARL